ncbi:MAG: AMP-binding protein, partial [Acidimicrobiia bacterium]|nr:AMP-binding protein [Acidimicrobiia bacterium]
VIVVGAEGAITRLSYAHISEESKRLAEMMSDASIIPGDRIMVMLPRSSEWIVTMVACARLGCVSIPCITMLTAGDLAYRVEHSGARAVITTADNASKFRGDEALEVKIATEGPVDGWLDYRSLDEFSADGASAARVRSSDPAILYYTSGSTGGPKGVLHAAAALFVWGGAAEHWLSLDCGEVIWCTADTGWSKAGTSILFGPFSRGATTVMYDGPFDPARRLQLIDSLGVDVFCAAATELRRLILEPGPFRFSRLRSTVSAGESVNPELVVRWKELTGIDVLDGYGQTETLMTVTNVPGRPVEPGSMGRALPGTRIAVLDAANAVQFRSASGELLIAAPSPQLMLGYYGEEDRTARCYLEIDNERWFKTGDNVEIDHEGNVFYLGRTDDIINSSGYRIGPQEVENALIAHPDVLECAVVGHPDNERGEIVVAFVVLVPSAEASAETLQQHVKQVTAPYKYPRRVVFVDDLPKTVSGKLRRNELRKAVLDA